MRETVKRIFGIVTKKAKTYHEAYYMMQTELMNRKLYCYNYHGGCLCSKCQLRDQIENMLIDYYYRQPLWKFYTAFRQTAS